MDSEARLATVPQVASAVHTRSKSSCCRLRATARQANADISSIVVVGFTRLVELCNSVVVRGLVREELKRSVAFSS